MKVTVGIPCYKQAQYLPDAITSALSQTYKDIEVIVVNDGSPDDTKEVAERFPVKVVTQVNKGLASARNAAIMNMRGQYFLPLDADDILTENCVEELVRVAKATQADVIAPFFPPVLLRSCPSFSTSSLTSKFAGKRPSFCPSV